MGIRVRRAEDTMIHLPDGDWLVVKKHLTYGDTQEIWRRMWIAADNGQSHVDTAMAYGHLAHTLQYVLDWSIADADGKVIPIKNGTGEADPAKILAALQELDAEDVKVITDAIVLHDTAMREAREAEKKIRAGGIESHPISGSVA